MRAVVQRVTEARVEVEGEVIGRTRPGSPGFLVLLAAGDGDTEVDVDYMVHKICGLRVFEDAEGRMNLGLADVGGSLLVVSQFTLFGDCRKGRRPSFVHALEPVAAAALVDRFVARSRETCDHVEAGRFQADMQVHLVNDGPVTLLIDSRKTF